MPVGAMAPDLVDQHPQSKRMSPRNQCIEVPHGSKNRIDSDMIGHVIAEIALRRDEERTKPDRIGAQPRDMVQVGGDSRQVADAIAIQGNRLIRLGNQ